MLRLGSTSLRRPLEASHGVTVATHSWMELPFAHNSRDYVSRVLLGLVVFQDLCRMEYIRSIHLYRQGGAAFTVQQEFFFKPGAFSQISEPIQLARLGSISSAGLKQFMAMLRKVHECEWWQCILEFRSDSPCDTAIVPFLSASRNPDLQSIPSLAVDLRLVEFAVSHRMALSSSSAVADTSDDGHASYLHERDWQHPKRRHPSLLFGSSSEEDGFTEPIDHGRGAESSRLTRSLQLDVRQKWGSDLELAGPRISGMCGSAIPRGSISDTKLSLYTGESRQFLHAASTNTPSQTSSSFSSQNGESTSWVPSAPVENCPAALDFSNETPTIGNDFFSGEAEIFLAKLPMSVVTQGAHIDCFPRDSPGGCSMTTKVQGENMAAEIRKADLMPQAIRTTSLCSETGVGFAEEVDDWYCQSKDSKRSFGMAESAETAVLSRASNQDRREAFLEGIGVEGRGMEKQGAKLERCSHSRGSTERLTELSMTELSQYFNMPISQASKELKVGLTVLKRRCREFGIPRWPHRKMKSLQSLILNIQDLAKDDGANHTNRVLNAVKLLEEQKKAVEEKPETELAERTKRLRQACFKASYKKRRKQEAARSEATADRSLIPIFTDGYNMQRPSSLICG